MAMAMEFIGLSPMGTASAPAVDPRKDEIGHKAGELILDLLRRNVRPRDILTRASFDNAIAGVAASGGSTNAVLHLLALAREADVELNIDDFDTISRRTPLIADLMPGGRYAAADLDEAGGIPLVARRLAAAGLVDTSRPTPSGRTFGEEADLAVETDGQDVVRTADAPFNESGGLVILKGNLTPDGAVIKLFGYERLHHRGPARVFDSEHAASLAVTNNEIRAGDVVSSATKGQRAGPGCKRC